MILKEIRKKHHLTQAECAKYLNIPLRTYQNYEKEGVDTSSFKYVYMVEKLKQYGFIDEEHGLLKIEDIKKACQEIFADYPINYCYLFGSYAKGSATEKSDVDLFISTEIIGLKYFELVERLRERLKKKVDLLDQNQIKENFNLTNEILESGVKIYG